MNGWFKLHRKILNNEIWRKDRNAWHLFETLLILANYETGVWEGGRITLSQYANLKPSTTYVALKRLEKHKMITLSSNSKYTVIHICKWHDFQTEDNSTYNSKITAKQQQNNTIIINKEINNNKLSEVSTETSLDSFDNSLERKKENDQIIEIYLYYIEKFNKNKNQFKLTDARKKKIKARLKDSGIEQVKKAILNTSLSSFHMGDNDRNWKADLDFVLRSYEQIERLSSLVINQKNKAPTLPKPSVPIERPQMSEEERIASQKKIDELRKKLFNKN